MALVQYQKYRTLENKYEPIHLLYDTVVCISLETRSVAKQVSVAVGWVKTKILLMAQLKGLKAKFKFV